MYAFFGLVALLESRCQRQCVGFHLVLISVIFIMSAVIEVLQATVVATRSAEWFDLMANFMGLVAAYLGFRIIGKLGIFKSIKF